MKFGGFKGQMMLYPDKHLDIKKSIWRLKSKMAANNNQNALKNLYNNDTTVKFGGFKDPMMLYPNKHLDMKKIQYSGYNPRWLRPTSEMLEEIFQTMIQP